MTNEAPESAPNTPNSGNKKTFTSGLFKALLPLVIIIAIAMVGLQLIKAKLNSGTTAPAVSQEGGDVATTKVGSILPDFTLRGLDGKTRKVSEVGGKVLLLNFWATWCEACVVEMPSIVKLEQLYKDKGLVVAGVNLDDKPEAVVPNAAKKLGIDFSIYTDADGVLANLFDVHAIPLTIIMDKNRKVLHVEGGERDWTDEDMKAKMNGWLSN